MNTTGKRKRTCRRSKKLTTALVLIGMVGAAKAQQTASSESVTNTPQAVLSSSSVQNETINEAGSFGVGPLLGEPMGVGVKFWLSQKTAIDGGAGWSFADPDGFQLHG